MREILLNKCESPLEMKMVDILLDIRKEFDIEIIPQFLLEEEKIYYKHFCHEYTCWDDTHKFMACTHERYCNCEQRQIINNTYRYEKYRLDFLVKLKWLKLDIECDGDSFHTDKNYDRKRDEYMDSSSIEVLRFSTDEILEHYDYVKNRIIKELKNV